MFIWTIEAFTLRSAQKSLEAVCPQSNESDAPVISRTIGSDKET